MVDGERKLTLQQRVASLARFIRLIVLASLGVVPAIVGLVKPDAAGGMEKWLKDQEKETDERKGCLTLIFTPILVLIIIVFVLVILSILNCVNGGRGLGTCTQLTIPGLLTSLTETPTNSPALTNTPMVTATFTVTPTPTPTDMPTPTATATEIPTVTPTRTYTSTPSDALTETLTSTPTAIETEFLAMTPVILRIIIFRDENSLVIYVPPSVQSVSLQGITLEVEIRGTRERYRLEDYPAFGGFGFGTITGPLCFVLESAGNNSPLPQQCQGLEPARLLVQRLSAANVFWYDASFNQGHLILIMRGTEQLGLCPEIASACPIGDDS